MPQEWRVQLSSGRMPVWMGQASPAHAPLRQHNIPFFRGQTARNEPSTCACVPSVTIPDASLPPSASAARPALQHPSREPRSLPSRLHHYQEGQQSVPLEKSPGCSKFHPPRP
ncbi:uncharacterized protein LOC116153619 [Camelus dromedarius]|uniref:uncharacterized protein LOC116153619 n=1 Tax=Camelus dromedarius TaxID=9838 RepID=UPI003119F335